MRAIPGQHVHLSASEADFTGPQGKVPAPAITWNGSIIGSSGGGTGATCANGALQGDEAQPLILGWDRSGTVLCNLTLSIAPPPDWQPGTYAGSVNLRLWAE